MTRGQHIALFGGSFDPPHLGHVFAAYYAKLMTDVDAVWIFPVARHAYHKALTAWDIRWQLCQAAFADLSFVEIRDDEQHNSSGYTFDLLATLVQTYPQHRWSLVGGSDTAKDLPNWYRGQELANIISVIPVPRRGFDEQISALPAISSSLIRERLAKNSTIDDLVPKAAAQLIHLHKWYKTDT